MTKFEKATGLDQKSQIAGKICDELKIHTIIEEEIFYPAFRGKIEGDTLDEAYVEFGGESALSLDFLEPQIRVFHHGLRERAGAKHGRSRSD